MDNISKKCKKYLMKLEQFIKQINSDFCNEEKNNSSKQFIFFRGESDYSWKLEPKICREGYKNTIEIKELNKEDKEYMFANAQHYGKITRTIDFTKDYKVALFFACESQSQINRNGAIYILKYIPHSIGWISEYIMRLVVSNYTYKNKIMTTKEISELLVEDDKFVKKCKRSYQQIYDEIKKYHNNKKYVMKDLCNNINNVLGYGFLTNFTSKDYKKNKKNKRIKKQKGVLLYCGSHFCIRDKKYMRYITNSMYSPYFKINIHKVQKPLWITKKMIKIMNINKINYVENAMIYKIKIPKTLKEEILIFTKYNKKKVGLD